MLSSKQTLIVDLITNFWILAILITLFLLLPLKTSYITSKKISKSQIVGSWLRIMLMAIIGVLSLSYLNLLDWLTLALLYNVCLIFNYLETHNWQIKYRRQFVQNKLLNLVDVFDRGISWENVIQDIINTCQRIKQKVTSYLAYLMLDRGIILVVILALILGFAILLRWQYPLLELRFSHPDRYSDLLLTRQILNRNYPEINYLPVFPAWAAMISLFSSIDSMHVIRFLGAILGIIMVLSLGYLVQVLTDHFASALVAMLSLGLYLFAWESELIRELPEWSIRIIDSLHISMIRQWTGNELELGAVFVLLSLGYYFDTERQQRKATAFKLNLLCGIILVAMSAPQLLIVIAIAGIGVMGGKRLALTAISLSWIILAVFGAITQEQLLWTQSYLLTLPIALGLLTGLIFNVITEIVKLRSYKWTEIFCLTVIISLSLNFLIPLSPNPTYVEYDLAARKSLELKNLFPTRSWTLVAPVEQLSEIYGSGWYEDLALFVEQYAKQANNPEFNFPISGKHLFVLVEKVPFVTFPQESQVISNHILGDRTYQYYRSSAGRASLEFEALQMCEAYRRNHPDSEVYYEDRELRIYHFKA